MNLTEKQIELLKKYNVDYKVDSVADLLINIDLIMTKYLDKNAEPTKDYMVLEKLYDEVYDLKDTK
jgi:hypothetical protein|nr:MAG TPA: hypothetical protein [Caudoviricetes sp.]